MLAVSEEVRSATDASKLHTPEVRAVAVHAHDRVLAAIAAGDAVTARRRMDAHVRAYGALLTALYIPILLMLIARRLTRSTTFATICGI